MTIFLIILSVILLLAWLFSYGTLIQVRTKHTKDIAELKAQTDAERQEFEAKIRVLEEQKNQLQKYQTIVDADAKAKEILSLAEAEAAAILRDGRTESEGIIGQSKLALVIASGEAKELKAKAEAIMESATINAEKVIADANRRAEEIAGEAYEALKKADSLEKTAKAMKNIIEGYGDQYIIPSYTLLDQLADDYSHTQAGEELKRCRERVRFMIRSGTAAKCDYVETNRKDTAITFVLDAFNGKVDSIFATLKHDNYGTLLQKIKDAFHTVNNNGKAFRNALITEDYLQLRMEELKWAATVQELKFKEREEQRQIKEQIREEEKARRDYEKAIREAEKEEEILKKAMEKVQKELGQATEEQKAKYEAQLKELQDKLTIAEEKNKRALSMAQQTKTGHVYVISNIGSFGENVYKIGMTRRLEPLDRVKELGDASVPFEFDVHSMILSEDAPTLERELHKKFVRQQINKVNPRKEFFRVTLKDVKEEIERMGIDAKWTLLSEAREYKESLAIEEAIKNHTINEDEWAKRTIDNIPLEPEKEEESVQ